MIELGYLATRVHLITMYYTEILHGQMYAHLFLTTLISNHAAKIPMYTIKSVHWYPCNTEVIRAHTDTRCVIVVHVESGNVAYRFHWVPLYLHCHSQHVLL